MTRSALLVFFGISISLSIGCGSSPALVEETDKTVQHEEENPDPTETTRPCDEPRLASSNPTVTGVDHWRKDGPYAVIGYAGADETQTALTITKEDDVVRARTADGEDATLSPARLEIIFNDLKALAALPSC